MPHLLLSALGIVCPTCDELSPAGTATCPVCRTALLAASRRAPVAVSAAPVTESPLKAPSEPGPRVSHRNSDVPALRPETPALRPETPAVRPPEASPAFASAGPSAPPGMRRLPGMPTPVPGEPSKATLPGVLPRSLLGATPASPPLAGAAAPGQSAPPAPSTAPPRVQVPWSTPGSTPAPAPVESRLFPPPSAPAARPAPVPTPAPARPAAPVGSKFIVGVVAGPAKGQRFRLMASGCSVGRSKGAILFPDDTFVSPQHAAFRVKDGNLYVRDEQSVSGVYVSIQQQENIPLGALFCAGSRLFRYLGAIERRSAEPGRPLTYGAPMPLGSTLFALEEVLVGGRSGRILSSPGPILTIGLAHCDLSFPQDVGMASRHCELSPLPNGALLRDLSGGLGTFVRLQPQQERMLHAGDRVRIGQQILQVEVSG